MTRFLVRLRDMPWLWSFLGAVGAWVADSLVDVDVDVTGGEAARVARIVERPSTARRTKNAAPNATATHSTAIPRYLIAAILRL